jgi:hypothetical protein
MGFCYRGWSPDELAQLLQRIGRPFHSARYRVDYGSTEDGDAWFALEDLDEDQVIFQIVRLDGRYRVALDPDYELTVTDSIDAAIDAAVRHLMETLEPMESPNLAKSQDQAAH